MSVVVTGSSGFIGRHLVAALLARGERVVAIDRELPAPPAPGLHPLMADLADRDPDVVDALRGASAVFHLAGAPGVRDTAPDVEHRRWRDNVVATEVVLAATPSATPLVVTSSSSVYGGSAGPSPRGCREDDPLRPLGGYARSKAMVELRCARRRDGGGAVAVARPFTVAGEGQRPDMAIATWLAAATEGRPLTVLGSPGRTRDITDVNDVVRALVAMADRALSRVLNVGTGVGHRLDALIEAVHIVTGAPAELVVVPASGEEVVHTLADTSALEATVGFRPATDLYELVARQAAAAGLAVCAATP